jgi:cation diffusion facilitator CzcD-associated flavoprotein CzcO
MKRTQLLIVGAGPYGLATAAYAAHRGVDCWLVGEPMEFWYRHMPAGMYLRSGDDWHLDPLGVATLAAYVREQGVPAEQTRPIPLGLFRDYAGWFRERYALRPRPGWVREVRRVDGRFEADLEAGGTIETVAADNVLLALGFASFQHLPDDLLQRVPPGRATHTCALVDFAELEGRRGLIVGGRQSAYEWAALIAERGAAAVHVAHRHPPPRFAASDWSWVEAMIRASAATPGWFRRLPAAAQEAIRQRFWAEGRLKLEPWLAPRLDRPSVHVWPGASLAACEEAPGGLRIRLDTGATFEVDQIILATGFRVDVLRVPCLARDGLLPDLQVAGGYPVLDEDFQSSVAGLYFTGLPATQDFGPFFGFVAGCRVAPRRIVERIRAAGG